MTDPVPQDAGAELPSDDPDAAAGEATAADGDHRRHPGRTLVEWVAILVAAVLVAVVVQAFVVKAFYIPSLSMYPTLDEGDRVMVNRLSYRLHDVNRGDVVVFERPPGAPDDGVKDLIKRVIGLPGEVIEARDGAVHIDGRRLDEPYVDEGDLTVDLPRQVVPDGTVFVMGDNRDNSQDSRVFGPIDEDLIVGRAFVTIWPIGAWRFL